MSGGEHQQNRTDPVAQGTVSVAEVLHYIAEDRFITLAEACRYLSLSERTKRERRPEIRHYRMGAKLLFKKSDLDRWMEWYGSLDSPLRLRGGCGNLTLDTAHLSAQKTRRVS
jgi:excisionase family DNA binding protein